MADKPSKQALLFSVATGQPIDDDPEILEALGLLSLLADRAMVDGADPSASVSPDHTLLLLCDYVIMAKRQEDQLFAAWRATAFAERERGDAEWKRARRTVRKLLLKILKFPAQTPAGLFAKAAAVSRTGSTAAGVAVSLANDLLASAELRRAVWPVANRE
jgi:hypothetical protein